MPSLRHEGLVLLLRNRPELVAELLRDVFGVAMAADVRAVLVSDTLRQVRPVEVFADAVVLLEAERRIAAIVEVQLAVDDDKRATWPVYVPMVRRELGCPCVLLVVALDDAVARWCARPIEDHGDRRARTHRLARQRARPNLL